MKKHIVIPFSICLFLIVLSGLFLYRKYVLQVESKKELMVWHVSETKLKLDIISLRVSELPHIVKSIIGESGMMDTDIDQKYPHEMSLLEQFYIDNNYFIRGISVYDRNGDVFNLYRDKKDSAFIRDVYRPRSITVLTSEPGIVVDNSSFSMVNPVFQGKVLVGNVAVSLDLESMQQELYQSGIEKGNIWATSIFNEETTQTFPLEGEWELSHEKNISWGVWERKSGFLQGRIKGRESSSVQVVTYYESLMIPEHYLGIAFSYNISPLIASSLFTFIVFVIILIALAFAASFIINRMLVQHRDALNEKNEEIKLLQLIFSCAPVGIMVNRNNTLFTANNFFFTLLNNYLSLDDIGKNLEELNFPPCFFQQREQEFEGWDIFRFEKNGKEICLGQRQMNMELRGNQYLIDTFWDITEMEQRLKDAVHSEIAKSELLRRVSVEVKKMLASVGDDLNLLMQKFSKEDHITSIYKSTANLSVFIDEVQDYANIEAGRIVLDEIPFNLVEEIKKVTDAFQPEAQRKGIEMIAHVASSAIRHIVSDPQRFRQILTELLSNAINFTDEGSIRISLETTELQGRKVLVKCSVEDTGRGMQREKLKNLFLIDVRAKEETEPIGLGIIITRKLVNMMGGTLRASSPSPIAIDPSIPGMQFFFSITCFSDQPFDKHIDYSSFVSPREVNVLLITSNAGQMQYLANFLSGRGIQSDMFVYNRDSDELLVNKLIIDKSRYQMVVISAASSEMTFSLAEEIHREELTGNCLYVLVDTHSQKGNYVKAKALNMDYYFVQSSDISVYDAVIKTHFPNLSDEDLPTTALVRKELRILVAEDNELTQKVAKIIFEKMGYEVDCTSNALTLINHLNRKSYDAIFMDLTFPPNDAFDMTGVLRMKEFKMPVIAMTSNLNKKNLKRIGSSGLDGFVPKPLKPESIEKILGRLVR